MFRVEPPENDEERDVQRRRLVERLVEAGQRGEQNAGKAVGLRLLKRELERKQNEADDRHDLRGEQAPAMGIELGPGCADEERQTVEGVDRPIRNDGPVEKRDVVFPREHDGGNIVALRRDGIRRSVGQIEERREKDEPADRAPPRTRLGRRDGKRLGSAHEAIRSATDTVKMPHSSMRCSIFLNPAAATS